MRILIVNPPLEGKRYNRPGRWPSFGYASKVLHPPLMLAYAASFLRAHDHEVRLIDAIALSMSPQKFFRLAEEYAPAYAILETSTASFYNDAHVADKLNKKTNCRTVFVGPHVSAVPQESLVNSNVDAVITGEYEHALLEYIERGPVGVRGICYRNGNGDIILNPSREPSTDLDSLPYPARDMLPNDRYFDPILPHPFTYVLSSRGCPFKCTFCNWPQVFWGHRFRARSPKNVADELEHIEQKYQFRSFLFNDDTFTIDKKRTLEICEQIVQRGLTMEWGCYARPDISDRKLLEGMRRAGCFLLKVGVESGSQQILNNIRKGTTVERIREGTRTMKKLGFHVHATFIFGMPGETRETIQQTIEFAKELDPTTVQFSTAIPYPKTEFYNYLEEKGCFINKSWDTMLTMQPIYEYPELPVKQLTKAVKKAYRGYYLRKKYVKIGVQGFFTEPRRYIANLFSLLRFIL